MVVVRAVGEMALDDSTEALSRRRRFIEGLLFRAVPALLFALIFSLSDKLGIGLSWHQVAPVVALLLLLVFINVPFWIAGRAWHFPLGQFYVHWAFDLIIITWIVNLLGGIDVPMVQFGYMFMILTAAIVVSPRTAYFLATGATLMYALLGIAETGGWVPPHAGIWAHHYGLSTRIFIVISSALFFYLMAYLASTMSEMLRRANEELASTKALVEDQNRLLEIRVRERTRELEASTLELRDRTNWLEEMVRIMTHDLQNVAVATMETARKLVEGDGSQFSARGQRYADRLVRDCRVMTTMLRNLLEVQSQTEIADHRELVDVARVVRDAVARAQTTIESKAIEVAIGDLPPVHAEQQKIGHVFENLVSNACKYVGDKPNPRIEVEGCVNNGSVEYIVRDNGVGIDASQMSRIFQLYHRAPDQMVAGVVQEGYGIGLSVVKRIVQRYGGMIWVESVPGEGSTFHLSFPRGEENDS